MQWLEQEAKASALAIQAITFYARDVVACGKNRVTMRGGQRSSEAG